MEITYKNYRIKVGEYSYDLYVRRAPKQVHRNKVFKKEIEVCLGYFSKLDQCLKRIIHYELIANNEIVDLSKFIELFKSITDEITNAINIPQD